MGAKGKSRKRKYRQEERQAEALINFGLGQTLGRLNVKEAGEGENDGDVDTEGLHTQSATTMSSQVTTGSPQADEKSQSEGAGGITVGEGAEEAATDETSNDWTLVGPRPLKQKRLEPEKVSMLYPQILPVSNIRLHNFVTLEQVRNLVLYILSNGTGPQWISVRNRLAIRKVVVLMVPGLEMGMFDGSLKLDEPDESAAKAVARLTTSDSTVTKKTRNLANVDPDEYYPMKLDKANLPEELKPLADMFPHVWPFLASGDGLTNRIHSPMNTLLSIPLSSKNNQSNGKSSKKSAAKSSFPTPITSLLLSKEALCENDFVLHPAWIDETGREQYFKSRQDRNQSAEDGWVDTRVNSLAEGRMDVRSASGGLTFGHPVLAIDCEMCVTSGTTKELTRISVVDWDLKVVMDELVKPDIPITNYLTEFSGITEERLKGVTTTLKDIQNKLLDLITPETILVGHSLNSDLSALKLTHPFIVDTTVAYPHPRGFPLKSSLKYLATSHLKKEIQVHGGSTGHDSIEDARSAMELVKMKCEKGMSFASHESTTESIFAKLSKSPRPAFLCADPDQGEMRKSAYVEWGDGTNGLGVLADLRIGCRLDEDVVDAVIRAAAPAAPTTTTTAATTTTTTTTTDSLSKKERHVEETLPGGADFIWARFRELEAVRGWWASSKNSDAERIRQGIVDGTLGSGAEPDALDGKTVERQNGSSGSDTSPLLSNPSHLSHSSAHPPRLAEAVKKTVQAIKKVYDGLPQYTGLIVVSGTGDPRELARLKGLHHQFKTEYQTLKWDQLTVKWTDVEEQACKAAYLKARKGCGFLTVK